jgi:methyl-accepting chemotaxis protein
MLSGPERWPALGAAAGIGATSAAVVLFLARANAVAGGTRTALLAVVVLDLVAIAVGAVHALRVRGRIRGIVAVLQRGAGAVLQAMTRQLAGNQLSGQALTEQSSAVAETTATVEELAATAATIAATARAVATAAEQTTATMREMQDSVEAISARTVSLGEGSAQIGQILELLDEIAEQTNLLALNAAIEAARAGEAGKGFAVVAGEVRKLAERSLQSTESIRELVAAVRDETNATIMATQQGARQAREVAELMTSTAAMLEDSIVATEQQQAASEQVAAAMLQIQEATAYIMTDPGGGRRAAQEFEAITGAVDEVLTRYGVPLDVRLRSGAQAALETYERSLAERATARGEVVAPRPDTSDIQRRIASAATWDGPARHVVHEAVAFVAPLLAGFGLAAWVVAGAPSGGFELALGTSAFGLGASVALELFVARRTAGLVGLLHVFTTTLGGSVDGQLTGFRRIGGAIVEQNSGVAETTATVEELAATAGAIADNARSVSATAEQTAATMQEVQESVEAIALRTSSLGERSKKIGEILELITEIAEQTNLLALNAAIEAARAGESGKGFAVVAAEVRKLAERSMEASDSIRSIVRGVQDETDATVAATERGTRQAREVADLMTSTTEMVEESILATQQQNAAAAQVAAAMVQVREASGTVQENPGETITATKELEKLAAELEQHLTELGVRLDESETVQARKLRRVQQAPKSAVAAAA